MNQKAMTILNEVCKKCKPVFEGIFCDAYLYGSYARGDFNKESDVDILITLSVDSSDISDCRDKVSEIISDISLEYDVTVSVALKPIELFNRYKNILPYYQNVLKEGIKYALA